MNNTAEEVANRTRNLQNKAGDFKDRAAAVGQKATGAVRDARAAADLYLHEYAWTTLVAVAFVAGTVGYLLGRKAQ